MMRANRETSADRQSPSEMVGKQKEGSGEHRDEGNRHRENGIGIGIVRESHKITREVTRNKDIGVSISSRAQIGRAHV